jgi:Na+/H+-dicarboxylate symporter
MGWQWYLACSSWLCILSYVIDFAKVNPIKFFKAIAPAQLLAFSTSSSAATLPVMVRNRKCGSWWRSIQFCTTVRCYGKYGWYKSISGSSSHFIAQAMLPNPLDLNTQLMIVVTATLASIGSAAVPSANTCYRFRSSWNSRGRISTDLCHWQTIRYV